MNIKTKIRISNSYHQLDKFMGKKLIFNLIIVFLFTSMDCVALKAPGELSKAHASLEGLNNCGQCHSGNQRFTKTKCLECHKEIQENINNHKGFHASSDVSEKECAVCHNEHHGKNFDILNLNKKKFNHSKTGFELKGRHQRNDCNACHQAKFISDPKLKNKPGTYLGLSSKCLNCHSDFHQGKLSEKCSECHNFESFKNAIGFDHGKTKYPLLGKHRTLACVKCHKTEVIKGNYVQSFKDLVFNNCTGCHKDVHDNKLGKDCKKCHTEESFHFSKNMNPFDHDKTDFKLIGRHKSVDCKMCHKSGKMTDPLKHQRCDGCHADFHNNEFLENGVEPDCNNCHTNNGFPQTTFTIERHSLKFKLEEAHLATSCKVCHSKDGKWSFRKMGKTCVSCHENIHKNFMQEKYIPNQNCKTCHNQRSWRNINFDHTQTNFKLEGTHTKIACGECHFAKNELGVRTQRFKGNPKECASCHKEPHGGQFEVEGKTDCTRCHGMEKFSKRIFEHSSSRFKLEGKHARLQCDECHKYIINEKGKYRQYKFDDITCAKCHG